jgi:hypothetical protein
MKKWKEKNVELYTYSQIFFILKAILEEFCYLEVAGTDNIGAVFPQKNSTSVCQGITLDLHAGGPWFNFRQSQFY